MLEDQYYKVKKDKRQYRGERYFKYNPNSEKVTQICVSPGEEKKGKSNTFGIYLIHKNTFLINYLTLGYVEKTNRMKYQHNFDKIVEYLK